MARPLRLFLLALLVVLALPASALAAGHNITISNSAATSNVSSSTSAGTTTFTATGDGAVLSQTDIATALGANNVVVATGSTGGDNGDIAVPSDFLMSAGITKTLDLQAANDISVTAAINKGGLLSMEAGHDIVLNAPNSQITPDTLTASATHSLQINSYVWTTGSQSWTGAATVAGGLTTSHGDITFANDMTLSADFGMTASGGTVTTSGTIDGAHKLSVTGNQWNVAKNIGATTPMTTILAASIPTAITGPASTIAASGTISLGGLDLTNRQFGGQPQPEIHATTFNSTTLNLAGETLLVDAGGTIPGVISGAGGTLIKLGNGTLKLLGTNTYSGGTEVDAGTLEVDGTTGSGDVLVAGAATLTGYGSTGALSASGTISPGVGDTATLTAAGLALGSNVFITNSHLAIDINGTGAGNFDQLAVAGGTVALGSGHLDLNVTTKPALGSQFKIIDNQTANPVNGFFYGLGEGGTLTAGGVTFRISYAGGDGNDVVLTVVQLLTPTVNLVCGPDPLVEGATVDCTATVSGPNGSPAPVGSVLFVVDNAPAYGVLLANGTATAHFPGLSVGTHSFRAVYAGDDNYTDGTSSTVEKTIAAKTVDSGGSTPPPATGPSTPSGATPVTISVADARAKANRRGRGSITFVLKLSRASASPVSVSFATKNGTAKGGRDFKALQGKLSFKPGATILKVKVSLLPRKGKAGKRKFSLVLSRPSGASLGRSVAIGTIS